MRKLSKELFIMALLLMIIVFMIGMIFYNYMPNNKTVPAPVSYKADSQTTVVLQEISSSSAGTDTDSSGGVQSIIKSYSIGAKELSTAASKQSYTSGKTDPFAEYKETETNTADGNTTGNTTSNNKVPSTSSNKNTNSTGTFFEKPNSK